MTDELTLARADAEFRYTSDQLCAALRDVLNDDAEDWCRKPQLQAHALAETLCDVLAPSLERDPVRVNFWLGVLDAARLRLLTVVATAKTARH